jgi:hypothetical protein
LHGGDLHSWNSCSLNLFRGTDPLYKKSIYLFIIPLTLLLLAGAFHHHPDGRKHESCSICYLTAHHSEYSSQTVLLFDPAFAPLEAVLPSERPFRPFLSFSFCPGRSPPSFLALS